MVNLAFNTINVLISLIDSNQEINEQLVKYIISLVYNDDITNIKEILNKEVYITLKESSAKPKTITQKHYIDQIKNNSIVIGVGPAGTGKTYLAVAMAVMFFKNKNINKIILTRPAGEAGEKLGFLPGDLQDKVDPYLRPLYDALFDMIGFDKCKKYLEKGNIEIAPLAYMRGRTLNDAFIILDEAQNTTHEQMKMFLTRIGFNSKMVITGDIKQIDIPDHKNSGLINAMEVLKSVNQISIVNFSSKDVVRHSLIKDIINAYNKFYEEVGNKKNV